MNHKRGKRKNIRAGCLMCKPWKMNGISKESAFAEKFSDHRRRVVARKEIQLAYKEY